MPQAVASRRRRHPHRGRAAPTTVDAIAAIQLPDGNIPWTPGDHTDPWNLVEAAMALDVGGRHDEAVRAYEWLRAHAARRRRRGTPTTSATRSKDPTLDTNVTCYIANGVVAPLPLHRRHRVPRATSGPSSSAAIDYALALPARRPARSRGAATTRADGALLTGSSSIHASLRCAIAIAERLGHERPDWELSLGCARHRDRAPARRVPRQGPLGDGLVLPDPRRRAPRATPRTLRVAARWAHVRRRGPRRPLRVGPAVGHRGGDVRARDGARRHRRRRPRARAVRVGAVPPCTRTAATGPASNFDDERFDLRRRALSRRAADLELRRGRARRQRARRHRPDRGPVPRRGPPRRSHADELLAAGVEIAEEHARK